MDLHQCARSLPLRMQAGCTSEARLNLSQPPQPTILVSKRRWV